MFLPTPRLLPFTVRLAVEPDIVADPRVALPSLKVTVPDGAAAPLDAFNVAVRTVLAEAAIVAGLATTVSVVATSGTVTVTVTEPVEFEKLPVAAKFAVILLLPTESLLPWTVMLAVDPEIVVVPRVLLPSRKVTVPAAAAVPLVGLTVAVSDVLPEEEMLAGLAASVVVVATGGAETATVTDPLDVEKFTAPE